MTRIPDLLEVQKKIEKYIEKKYIRNNKKIPKKTKLNLLLELDNNFQKWLEEISKNKYNRKKELDKLTDCLISFIEYQNFLLDFEANPKIIIPNEEDWCNSKNKSLFKSIKKFKVNLWNGNIKYSFFAWTEILKSRDFSINEILDNYIFKIHKEK